MVRESPAPGRMRQVRKRAQGTDHRVRVVVIRFLLIASLVAAGLKLVQVQVFEADALAARAERQRVVPIPIPARRGSIVDRNGVELAFSVEARALAYRPIAEKAALEELRKKEPATPSFEDETALIARRVHEVVGEAAPEATILGKLREDKKFVYLVENVEPAKARELKTKFPQLNVEYRAQREYPGVTSRRTSLGWPTGARTTPTSTSTRCTGSVGWRTCGTTSWRGSRADRWSRPTSAPAPSSRAVSATCSRRSTGLTSS
ncbi:Cell division protein FtsI [Peptidoglycan synthetase] [Alloactinosynnema sp. L-07]|nr:Cell division protein FtsI [Peptidoglycan synthetase] [Alloactinosynnema sp. L-07]